MSKGDKIFVLLLITTGIIVFPLSIDYSYTIIDLIPQESTQLDKSYVDRHDWGGDINENHCNNTFVLVKFKQDGIITGIQWFGGCKV